MRGRASLTQRGPNGISRTASPSIHHRASRLWAGHLTSARCGRRHRWLRHDWRWHRHRRRSRARRGRTPATGLHALHGVHHLVHGCCHLAHGFCHRAHRRHYLLHRPCAVGRCRRQGVGRAPSRIGVARRTGWTIGHLGLGRSRAVRLGPRSRPTRAALGSRERIRVFDSWNDSRCGVDGARSPASARQPIPFLAPAGLTRDLWSAGASRCEYGPLRAGLQVIRGAGVKGRRPAAAGLITAPAQALRRTAWSSS
jgi:hypothetical protein